MSTICDDLRAAILQAAMQGKLTKQLPEDGSAEDLLETIRALKSNDKKSKIQLGAVKNDDKPFNIPSSWRWGYFGDLVFNHDSERKPVSKEKRSRDNGQYPYYGATGAIDVVDDYIFDGDFLMIGEDGGNFFVSRDNSFIAHGKFWANNHVHVVSMTNMDINYMKHFLDSCNMPAMGLINGIAVPKLNQKNLNSIAVPIPPFAEQKRIAEKVDELMARVADLEQSADALASLKKAFPDDIKASLLQAAMQGKLTKQLPEDGSAEDLLEKVKAEKEKLIAEGKIKKQKPLAPITDDEIPFSIPENWKWVRLNDILDVRDGTHDSPKYVKADVGVPLVTSKNLRNGSIDYSDVKYISIADSEAINQRSKVDVNDILMAMIGTIGNPVKVVEEPHYSIKNMALLKHLPENMPNMDYILQVLNWAVSDMKEKSSGGVQKFVSLNFIREYPIPLPPLAEQKRIVEHLDSLIQNINVVGDLIASE